MRRTEILRRAFLPAEEGWPSGERLQWIFRGRIWMLPITMLANVLLWADLRDDPAAKQDVVDLFLVMNDSILAIDLLLTVLFMRRFSRAYPAVLIIGAVLETFTAVTWIQMTGTVTSYFIGTITILAIAYRFLGNYWSGLACIVTGVAGIAGAYVLEEAGVLPRSSAFMTDLGAATLPDAYRQTAFLSVTTAMVISFTGFNLLAHAFERGRRELVRAQAELAAVVDEARLGRLSGQSLGRYQLGELLGRGGMGEVYAALGPDGQSAAIKVLHAHLGADGTSRLRFRREADVVQRLPATCTPSLFEIGEAAGCDFIAMERLHGEDLAGLLRRRERLAVREVITLVGAIAQALAVAHAAGVVHRDLKPSNVFLVGAELDDVRLLDFGIARLYETVGDTTLTGTDVVLGSPGYLAPEQVAGDRGAIGPACDVFALGAIAFRALAGVPAFPSRSTAAALHEALYHVPDWPAPLPLGVERAVAVALAKEPRHRYDAPRELAADLRRGADGDPLDHLESRATGARSRASIDDLAATLTDVAE